MAETSSFPEQWLVPLASSLRRGVDDRMHWVTEAKNFGGGLYGVRKGVGLPTPGIMGRVLATASLHFALLKYTLLRPIQMPSPSRPSARGRPPCPLSCSHL